MKSIKKMLVMFFIVILSIISFNCYFDESENIESDDTDSLRVSAKTPPLNPNDFAVGDWNNDEKDDIFRCKKKLFGNVIMKNPWCALSNGKKFHSKFDTYKPNAMIPPYDGMTLLIGQFGGDYHDADFVVVYNSLEFPQQGSKNYIVERHRQIDANFYGYKVSQNFQLGMGSEHPPNIVLKGNVNGDTAGYDDLVHINFGMSARVYINTGYGNGTKAFKDFDVWLQNVGGERYERFGLGDVKSDHKADLVIFRANGDVDMAESTGSKFKKPKTLISNFCPIPKKNGPEIALVGNITHPLHDIFKDFIFIKNGSSGTSTIKVAYKSGSGWKVKNAGTFHNNPNALVLTGDFNGDYLIDLVSFEGDKVYVYKRKSMDKFYERSTWMNSF